MTRHDHDSDPPSSGAGSEEPNRDIVPLRHEDGARIVSERTIARARTIAEALFLTTEGPPPTERLDWLDREVEDFLARAGARSRFVVSLALFAVSVLAPLMLLRFVPLARLSVVDRARALGRLEDTFGAPVLAAKALLCVIYYEHPDAALSIGFDGQCKLTSGSPHLPTLP